MKRKKIGPEKLVEAKFKAFADKFGWSLDVIESKAQFSPAAGIYRKNKGVPEGFSDMVGVSHDGTPVYLELKAPGKLSTVRETQVRFLANKINYGAFAVVTDDPGHMIKIWNEWNDRNFSKEYLLGLLKKSKSSANDSHEQ